MRRRNSKGEELFSSYPAGRWKPLSAHPVFYKKILAKLNQKDNSLDPSDPSISSANEDSPGESAHSEEEPIEATRIVDPRKLKSSPKIKKQKSGDQAFLKSSKKMFWRKRGVIDVEEEEIEEESFLRRLKVIPVFLLIVSVSVIAVLSVVFLRPPTEERKEGHYVRLRFIQQKRSPWAKKDLKAKWKLGLKSYMRGTMSGYLEAQKQYVQILEGNPDQEKIYLYLCLVYLELWPFSYQDSQDKQTLNNMLNLASEKDKGGVYSGVCRSVQKLINKKPEQSLMITDSSLRVIGKNHNPIFFYYIKARALKDLNRHAQARMYLQSIHKFQDKWILPYMLSAQMFYEKRQYDMSAKLYQKVLTLFPRQAVAGFATGRFGV